MEETFSEWCERIFDIGSVNDSDMADDMTLETLKWHYLAVAYDAGYEAAMNKINNTK